MKRCSTSLVLEKMQIKTARSYSIATGIAITKQIKKTTVLMQIWRIGTSYIASGNVKWRSC
jgi:hypothetical protein